MSKINMNDVATQYQDALNKGVDPYKATDRLYQLTKQAKIEDGADPLTAEKDYLDQGLQLAIKYGADPKQAQERYNDLTTQLELKKLLSKSGSNFYEYTLGGLSKAVGIPGGETLGKNIDEVGDNVLSTIMGTGKQTLDVVHGVNQAFKDLGVYLGIYDKEKADAYSKQIAQFNKSYDESPFVQAHKTASDIGEYATGISQAYLSGRLGGGGILAQAAKQGLSGAATGAIMPTEGTYEQRQQQRGTNSLIGGIIGVAGGALGGFLDKSAKYGRGVTNNVENQAVVKEMMDKGIVPTAGQYVGGTKGNILDTTYDYLPFSGAKKTFANQTKKLITSIDDFVDDLKQKNVATGQSIANVDDIENNYIKYALNKNPEALDKNLVMADDMLVNQSKNLIKNIDRKYLSSDQKDVVKYVYNLINDTDPKSLEQLYTIKKTISDQAFASAAADKPLLKQLSNILDQRINRAFNQLGMPEDYIKLKDAVKRVNAYNAIKSIYDSASKAGPGNTMDLKLFNNQIQKAITRGDISNLPDIKNALEGFKNLTNKLAIAIPAYKGTYRPGLVKMLGGGALGTMGIAGSYITGDPKYLLGTMAIFGGTAFLGKMLSTPSGIKLLESMGKNAKYTDKFVKLLTRTAVVEGTNNKEEK